MTLYNEIAEAIQHMTTGQIILFFVITFSVAITLDIINWITLHLLKKHVYKLIVIAKNSRKGNR